MKHFTFLKSTNSKLICWLFIFSVFTVLLLTNKSKGGYYQPFFDFYFLCSKEQKLWGLLWHKLMSFKFFKKWRIKNQIFDWISWGQEWRKGRGELQCIFCVCDENLSLTPQLFHFEINVGFEISKEKFGKDFFDRRFELIFQRLSYAPNKYL